MIIESVWCERYLCPGTGLPGLRTQEAGEPIWGQSGDSSTIFDGERPKGARYGVTTRLPALQNGCCADLHAAEK